MSIEGTINFIIGKVGYGWPVEAMEIVDLEANSESAWFFPPREAKDLTVYSGSICLNRSPSEPGVSCVLEQRRERELPKLVMRLLWWLSKRCSFVSPWIWVTVRTRPFRVEAGQHRADFGFDSPMRITPGDHLRVKVIGVGEDAPGGGALISLKTSCGFAA